MEKALTGLVAWVDARLPITRAWDTHMGSYYAPKKLQLMVFLWRVLAAGLSQSVTDRYLVDDELYAER